MEPHEIMSASEAARLLGCSPEKVRQHIRAGVWKFGICVPKQKGGRYGLPRGLRRHIAGS